MAWGKTWMLTTMLLSGALGGCVQALPDRPDMPPEPPMCESFSEPVYSACECGSWCGSPPPAPTPMPRTPPGTPPIACENATYASGPRFTSYVIEPCAAPMPPLFEPFGVRAIRECTWCGEVAMVVDGDRLFLATAEGLDVVTPTRILSAPAPTPSDLATGWTLHSPAVATDGADVWYAALARASMGILPPFDALVVARWDGGAGWIREQVVPLEALPEATPATRVLLATTRDGVVALLETDSLAWSVRVADDVASPEPLGDPGARLRFGMPARDGDGRARVPFVRETIPPLGAGELTLGVATLPDVSSAWSFQHVPDAGRGGASGATPALETFPDGPDLALTWIDGMGSVVRARSWDGGATWGDPVRWRDAGLAESPPAAAHGGGRTTLAWVEGDRILLARGLEVAEGTTELFQEPRSAPALAMMGSGSRAAVAWISPEGGLLLAREGTWDPECDGTAHCRRALH